MNPDLELFLKTAKPEWKVREFWEAVRFTNDLCTLILDDDFSSAKANHIIEQDLVEEGYRLEWEIAEGGSWLNVFDRKATCVFDSGHNPTKAICLVCAWNALGSAKVGGEG